MEYEMGEATTHVKWSFGRLRFVSALLKEKIRRDGIWPDLSQELHATGFLAWKQCLSMEETRRLASRRIHFFLKSYSYKRYRNSYIKMEPTFSAVFADWEVRNLSEMESSLESWKDTAGDNHLKEHILNVLKRKPEGMTRAEMTSYLEVSVKELQGYLDTLLQEKRIVKLEREGFGGHPMTPKYFIAGVALPEQKPVKVEIFAEIRRLYFEERKTTKQIALERHHSLRTIGKAIHSAPVPLANAGKKELVSV
jgi:hypothetical protein